MTRFATASMLLALSASANAIDGGFQSGPSPGAFYSGGMTYIPQLNRAFLTGSHYNKGLEPHDMSKTDLMEGTELDTESSCYLAKVDFDDAAKGNTFHSLSDWVSYGNAGKLETCSAVAATKSSDVYVVGSVGDGGLFSDGHPMQGLLSIMDRETLGFIDATLIKSAQDPSKHMIYPLDIIHDFHRKFIYIAALTSTDAKQVKNFKQGSMPNWQEMHKLGSAFDVTVIKIHAPEGVKPKALWVQHFPLDVESDGTRPPVFVAGMALQLDENDLQHLVISGSTRGSGDAFGKVTPNSVDEDGFVMQLKLSDGSFIKHDRHKGVKYDYESNLREGTPSDDFIRGMCNSRGGGHHGEHKSDVFYVVGGTKGDMTTDDQGMQNIGDNAGFQFGEMVEIRYANSWDREESMMPFLRQVNIHDLRPTWTTQWAAMPANRKGAKLPTNAFAMDCFVDNNEEAVYVVGSVMDGNKMTQGDIELIPQGGDDIWVAKVDEATGNVYWLTQLGSAGMEKLARRGSIVVNEEGDVLIYGDTNGNMYRPRAPHEDPLNTDMFVMTIDGQTGAVKDDFYLGGTSSGSVSGNIGNGVKPVATSKPNPPETAPTPDDDSVTTPKPPKEDVDDKDTDNAIKKETASASSGNKAGAVFGILFGIAAFMGLLFVFMNRRMKRRKAEAQKSSIFACLQQFDVEDIDLRRSPPGGWHGTYMNKLAYGHNNADDMAVDSPTGAEGAPLTHSSVANDALFMDADDTAAKYRNTEFSIDDSDAENPEII